MVVERARGSSPANDNLKFGLPGSAGLEVAMSEGYSIEVADEIVGLVVRHAGERGFRFHAAMKSVDALDGHIFCKPRDAERAARSQLEGTRHRTRFPLSAEVVA
jgi:hypothetical protein